MVGDSDREDLPEIVAASTSSNAPAAPLVNEMNQTIGNSDREDPPEIVAASSNAPAGLFAEDQKDGQEKFRNGTSIMKTNPLMMYMFFQDADTPTIESSPERTDEEMSVILILHRGMVFEDLNEAVKVHGLECLLQQQPLHVQMLLPNGVNAAAEDTDGVLRDALSEYWETFFTKCSSDGDVRVPVLRHDMKNTWSLCACVLVLGYQSQGYLSKRLAVAFLQHCLGQCPSPKNITEASLLIGY
ncbi:hypothetical protein CAPTEDRAFT_194614 [Capitella teleta]|uniref:Uncharacterized protein n=1 Tax=Capitella teleta TaxID=283909 RepID=R7TGJ5_CAPTE|nr:hypothetical protein CAPTEDRAFT_194614 [Capitella teleta]|eukprot:ELT92913.1 hypothetical protein CAPTEDRAFT_194614 [Capitella teleta]